MVDPVQSKVSTVFGLALIALSFAGVEAGATEFYGYLPDTYIGSNDHNGLYDYNNTDAIGGSEFDIIGATGTRVVTGGTRIGNTVEGGTVTDQVQVSIYTLYDGSDYALTNFGDLLINPRWTPNTSTACTSKPYPAGSDPCDNYATGTKWQFGVSASSLTGDKTRALAPGGSVSGTGTIYSITDPSQLVTSFINDPAHECNEASAWVWRNGQPVQVATQAYAAGCSPSSNSNSPDGLAHKAAQALSTDATWTFVAADPGAASNDPNNPNGSYNVLTYTFDADPIDAVLADDGLSPIIDDNGEYDFAMSWAITCANDIIQGQLDWSPVPEPSSLAMSIAGLAALTVIFPRACMRPRRIRQKNSRNSAR
ncbi:MAG: hypothetical protein ACREFQ_22295 [Stellaceae bacterium]